MTSPTSQPETHAAPARLDQLLAGPMFAASCLFLLLCGTYVHMVQDPQGRFAGIAALCSWGMLALYPLFVAEAATLWWTNRRRWNILLCGLLPPLRIGCRDHSTGRQSWLPCVGWVIPDESLQERVHRSLSLPMLAVALLVLPLLIASLLLSEQMQSHPLLALVLQVAEIIVWFAFTLEFIVMISIVDKKVAYAKEHWLDIAIICLPLIAFLRAARLGRITRLKVVSSTLSKLPRTARIFRLRGAAMRLWRALLLMEVIDRVLRSDPEQRLERLRSQLREKEQELDRLRAKVEELEADVLAESSALAAAAPNVSE
ncbi:hypothetical protein Mal4_05650 [Maioricimonas rarisocia]|uniref:Ion transport protein n=1 Tax=Maioricimonas rarisocia TaxID=2528026 RepID=A0A517Z1C7_9PLAN|nr:prefoldin subunit [Maioricimonas rarisocia]QDU36281.1 hypothetical protein Mal4_05650 [Maioricimonas rarisocia]